MAALRKFFEDKNGHIVLFQMPNAPLITWLVARILQWPLKGRAEFVVWLIGTIAIVIWALLELVKGVTYFRRTLGAVVLVLAILSVIFK